MDFSREVGARSTFRSSVHKRSVLQPPLLRIGARSFNALIMCNHMRQCWVSGGEGPPRPSPGGSINFFMLK